MGRNPSDSTSSLLRNVIDKYKNTKFNVFHMGYPYERESIVLAKTYRNAYFDMNWAHSISPHAACAAFSEALDVVPYNKILAFGGDVSFYDGVAGHLSIAKENVCNVFAGRVHSRQMIEDMAIRVLHAVFRDNARKVFDLCCSNQRGEQSVSYHN